MNQAKLIFELLKIQENSNYRIYAKQKTPAYTKQELTRLPKLLDKLGVANDPDIYALLELENLLPKKEE